MAKLVDHIVIMNEGNYMLEELRLALNGSSILPITGFNKDL